MEHFDKLSEARDKAFNDGRYSQDEVCINIDDVNALLSGKVLYHDFDDKSCIIWLSRSSF